jgi:hypothetical protein
MAEREECGRMGKPTGTPTLVAVQKGYNEPCVEFYVLSMLYRLGFDANLTLEARSLWTSP